MHLEGKMCGMMGKNGQGHETYQPSPAQWQVMIMLACVLELSREMPLKTPVAT